MRIAGIFYLKYNTRTVEMREFDNSMNGHVLRLGGNPWVQWFIVVWILAVLSEYFNADLGFGWVEGLFR